VQPGNTANTTPWLFNQTQINSTALLAGNGVTGTGSPRVTLASDTTSNSNAFLANLGQVNGVTLLAGNGVTGTGSPRVTIASDTTSNTNAFLANLGQINSVTLLAGNGVTGTGSPRVTIASDNTAFAVKVDQTTPGTTNKVDIGAGATIATGVGVTGSTVVRVVNSSNDPCQTSGIAKSSVVLNVTTSAQVIALSGTTVIYVCGWTATVGGTAPTYQFQTGTGSVCATGTVNRSGVFAPTVGSFNSYNPAMTAFAGASGEALCIATGGTTPSVQGVLTYVQQ
jgi:hypothetical protein